MGYIGSDPKTNESVSTAQLVDDSVTNAKIVDNVLFNSVTSSIVSASGTVTADTFTGTFSGALSSSAQIASNISGSLGANATVIRSLNRTTISGSTPQSLGTSDSPTFAGATITGTLTAQEIHTEFESASVIFTSGSTKFGDSGDDIHNMTGSIRVSGSVANESFILGHNFGIGINNPSANLHIGGTTPTIYLGDSGAEDTKLVYRGNQIDYYIGHDDSNNALTMGFGTTVGGDAVLAISGSKVGIGTTSPVSLLYLQEDNTTNVTDSASMISNSSLTINGNSSDGSDVIRMGAMSNATGDYFIEVSNAAGNAAYNLLLNPINGGKIGVGTIFGENVASSMNKFAVRSDTGSTHYNMVNIWEHGNTTVDIEQRIGWIFGDDGGAENGFGFAGYIGVGKESNWGVDANRDAYMSFGVALNNSVSERMRITADGNVGIGNTSPKEKLEVDGDIANYRLYSRTGIVNGALSFNSYYNGSAWVHDDNSKVSMNMYMSDTRDNLEFAVRNGGASDGFGTTHFAIGGDGKIGIGTESPAYTLDLSSSDAIVSQFVGSSGETILSLDNTSTNGDKWYLISGGSGGSFAGGKFGIYNADTTTAVATFTNNGNVGIGASNPNEYGHLHVRSTGDSSVTGSAFWDGYGDTNISGNPTGPHTLCLQSTFTATQEMGPSIIFRAKAGSTLNTSTVASIVGSLNVDPSGDAVETRGALKFFTSNGYSYSPYYGSEMKERMRIDHSGAICMTSGRKNTSFNQDGLAIAESSGVFLYAERSAGTSNSILYLHRRNGDGQHISFYESNSQDGYIQTSSGVVSLVGFQGSHEASGIPNNTPTGTVVSTIDEEFKYRHANVKISDTVGDKRVYGVVENFKETQSDDTGINHPAHFNIASVGVGHIRVTGSCAGGDLLESNGDGLAKVQDDDIIRSKTIGKVTANISGSATVDRLVACVLYCG